MKFLPDSDEFTPKETIFWVRSESEGIVRVPSRENSAAIERMLLADHPVLRAKKLAARVLNKLGGKPNEI